MHGVIMITSHHTHTLTYIHVQYMNRYIYSGKPFGIISQIITRVTVEYNYGKFPLLFYSHNHQDKIKISTSEGRNQPCIKKKLNYCSINWLHQFIFFISPHVLKTVLMIVHVKYYTPVFHFRMHVHFPCCKIILITTKYSIELIV